MACFSSEGEAREEKYKTKDERMGKNRKLRHGIQNLFNLIGIPYRGRRLQDERIRLSNFTLLKLLGYGILIFIFIGLQFDFARLIYIS